GLPRLLLQDEDVLGLEVAMNDALLVSGAEPDEQLTDQGDRLPRGEHRGALETIFEALPVEVLHDHEALAVRQLAQVEDLEDVIVADPARRLRLAFEALDGLRVHFQVAVE